MNTAVPVTIRRLWHTSPLYAPRVRVSVQLLNAVFSIWLLAFFLKHIGASWDVAWHFRFLRDDLIPPHMINLVGNGFAGALLFCQFRTGVAAEPRGFLVMLIGYAVFLIAIPLDVLNHRIFGLDVTIWSPTHLMLFLGSTIMLCGLLQMWRRLARPGRWKTVYTFVLFMFLMDCMIFELAQNEYGVQSLAAYFQGHSTASDDLLALARGDIVGFATGYVPSWVYPVWMILTSTGLFIVARLIQPGRWTATITAALYLTYRLVAYTLLVAASFPASFIPVMLLAAGLAIDLAARWHWRPLVTTIALLAAFYGSAALVGKVTLMPQFALVTSLVVLVPVWGMFVMAQRRQSAAQPTAM